MKKNIKYIIGAIISGFFNGAFGTGGGILTVPLLQKFVVKTKKAHATSVLIILGLSIISFLWYFFSYTINFKEILILLPFGLLGALVGSIFLKKIKTSMLRRIFGILIIISSLRLLFR